MRSGVPPAGSDLLAADTAASSATDAPAEVPSDPAPRPKLMLRLFAGTGVVLAALIPIAALVMVILHLCHVLPFGRLA